MSRRLISSFLNNLNNKLNYINYSKRFNNKSFSQCGEDMIINFIFDSIKIDKINWIDIGSYHPYKFNNTAFFYLKGHRGINIDADIESINLQNKFRPEDLNLNLGIDTQASEKDFYVLSAKTLNTFSKAEAYDYVNKYGYTIEEIRKIRTETITNIIQQYSSNIFPKLLCIDIEGLDEIVIKDIDFTKGYPLIICAETISFSENKRGIKNKHIINYLQEHGYFVFADTYINTIFVKEEIWV